MIDCHVHFWNYKPSDFPWISGDLQPIARDMLPLQFEKGAGKDIQGLVAVQARPSLDENSFLASLAQENKRIKAIIGWFDFDKACDLQIEKAKQNQLVKGFRYLIQDERDPSDYLENHLGLNQSIAKLQKASFLYEVLIRQADLSAASKFCARHDNYFLVIDHLAKPVMFGDIEFAKWQSQMRDLSQMSHVIMKISGLVSEADASVNGIFFQRYIDTVFELFGPERLLWGSDWPVSFANHSYETLLDYWALWTKNWTLDERLMVENVTPQKIYKL